MSETNFETYQNFNQILNFLYNFTYEMEFKIFNIQVIQKL